MKRLLLSVLVGTIIGFFALGFGLSATAGEHPSKEHPTKAKKSEHPKKDKSEHPKKDKSEHPKTEKDKSEHPK
ncbi:hypothetical protein ACFL4E_02245 [Candidatus Omnitrophota bacterium]